MNYTLAILSIALHLMSAYLFLTRRIKFSLLLLFISDIVLRYWFAHLDPFLNDWDETYHALVSKNLSGHWLIPTLIEHPVLSYDVQNWYSNHIWLHKQPVFLWQIAASIKLFGANIFAVRLPSILIGGLLVLTLFDIARKCFSDEVGYIAAFLFSFFEPVLEMNSGFTGMDHNTIAFIFYTTLSIWAWIRFEKNKKFRWIIMMGIFSGLAVLNKWLTGLLVFSGFGFYHLFLGKDFFKRETLTFLIAGVAACLITFLPWQVYTLIRFPIEARFELNYNSLHFSKVIEGHSGDTWYYVNFLKFHYKFFQSLIFIGFAFALLEYKKNALSVSLIAMSVITYTFFTLAATKLDEYVLLVSPLLFVFISLSIVRFSKLVFDRFVNYRIPAFICTILISYFLLDLTNVAALHDPSDTSWVWQYRRLKTTRTQTLKAMIPALVENDIIINCPDFFFIDAMFYTGHTAYGFVNDDGKTELISKGKHIVMFPRDL